MECGTPLLLEDPLTIRYLAIYAWYSSTKSSAGRSSCEVTQSVHTENEDLSKSVSFTFDGRIKQIQALEFAIGAGLPSYIRCQFYESLTKK
jgi:hypothetical protein